MKNKFYNKILSLALVFICSQLASAFEIRPILQLDLPSKVNIEKDVNGVKQEKKWSTDLVFEGGAEMIFSAEFSPIHYGFGLGYKSAQQKGSQQATPGALPVWGNIAFGMFNKDKIFSPYAVARVGYLVPLTGDGNWWERPFNFFVEGGIGTYLPYNIGIEVLYDYSSMLKSYESSKTKFRVSSGRIAFQLSVGFELSHDRKYIDEVCTKTYILTEEGLK